MVFLLLCGFCFLAAMLIFRRCEVKGERQTRERRVRDMIRVYGLVQSYQVLWCSVDGAAVYVQRSMIFDLSYTFTLVVIVHAIDYIIPHTSDR